MPCALCGSCEHNRSACPPAMHQRVTIAVLEDGDHPLNLVDLLLTDGRLDNDGVVLPGDDPSPSTWAPLVT